MPYSSSLIICRGYCGQQVFRFRRRYTMIRQKRGWLIQKTSCATDIAILTAQLSIISSVYNAYATFLFEFDSLSWNFPILLSIIPMHQTRYLHGALPGIPASGSLHTIVRATICVTTAIFSIFSLFPNTLLVPGKTHFTRVIGAVSIQLPIYHQREGLQRFRQRIN
ncbi:hypothetical protein ARMSODRAFT_115213 [Armillaria solidipes]|uniref:Uncharacterized protein n=1 Tax=Armillaria solidipes TaxID=1076256 RepID=A0A2H3BWS1_9AGAR|nr:hypothetical protein ARMSODRAFT_115213 [Armillaria solidipes]